MSQMMVQVRHFMYEHRVVLKDSVLLVLFVIMTGTVLAYFEVAEWIYEYSRDHEEFELDELILTIAISSIYLIAFILRRYFDLRNAVKAANTDPLIGITNRRKGSELIELEIDRMNLHQFTSSLILFDVDDFKQVNDNYGHSVGDMVLKEMSKRVSDEVRSSDIMIRWGGEEFLILCPRTDLNDASMLAERLREKIEATPFPEVGRITASFGVAPLQESETLKGQIDLVDQGLYFSKREGKNQVTVCSQR